MRVAMRVAMGQAMMTLMTLKEARDAQGLSQGRLAALTGGAVSVQTISQIENGAAIPRGTTRIVLAQALKQRVEDIAWPEQPQPRVEPST
jgi:DNA-binding XRE family transcriptional regulator